LYSFSAGKTAFDFVQLKVYGVLGTEIATLENEVKFSVGQDNILSLSSGVYFYRLQAGNFVGTKKMLILK